ncbi:MAG: lamin tail domain-containing protein [Sedimentisphaerales bacterium]|nr:lamin tail domain-containing protein [Sedimentisphaerales bacterium]
MEEDINRQPRVGKRIRQAVFYIVLFLSGFLISVFAREGVDVFRATANIASQTLGEAWSSTSNQKVIAKIPLTGAGKQTGATIAPKNVKTTVAKKPVTVPEAKKIYADTPLPPPPVVSQEVGGRATSSAQTQMEPVAQKEANSTPPETVPVPAAPPSQTPPASQENSIPPTAPVPPTPSNGKILFYEIQISGGTGATSKDFIRIYNSSGFNVDVGKWKLVKKSKTGTESSVKVIPDGTVIVPGGTLMWANSKDNFAATVGAQLSTTATISADNSVALFDSAQNIIDAVAWGEGANQFAEGSAYPTNPEGGQILRRKAENQILKDTNNNAADFSV